MVGVPLNVCGSEEDIKAYLRAWLVRVRQSFVSAATPPELAAAQPPRRLPDAPAGPLWLPACSDSRRSREALGRARAEDQRAKCRQMVSSQHLIQEARTVEDDDQEQERTKESEGGGEQGDGGYEDDSTFKYKDGGNVFFFFSLLTTPSPIDIS